MNYGSLASTITPELAEVIETILNTEIDPEVRRYNLEILFRETGADVYRVIYAMNAYDMEIEFTTGPGMNNNYYGLAKNISDSISLGGKDKVWAEFELWLQDVIHKAQYDAFVKAGENGKYRGVTRTERGDCCEWCRAHVGTFIEPLPEVFGQHEHCRGEIRTFGWKSKNGRLTGRGWKQQS